MVFQEYVYFLTMHGFEPSLTKVGYTTNIHGRLCHHASSFAAWELLTVLPLDRGTGRIVEGWFKELYQVYSWKGSPEIFLLPHIEKTFLSMLGPFIFRHGQHLTMGSAEEILNMSIAERFAHLFTQSGIEMVDVPKDHPPEDYEFWRAVHALAPIQTMIHYKQKPQQN